MLESLFHREEKVGKKSLHTDHVAPERLKRKIEGNNGETIRAKMFTIVTLRWPNQTSELGNVPVVEGLNILRKELLER